MRIYERGNIVIRREMTNNRFYDLVTAHKIDESGIPVAFLGKYTVPSNFTEEELFELYSKKGRKTK